MASDRQAAAPSIVVASGARRVEFNMSDPLFLSVRIEPSRVFDGNA
jgi:hypothetical protein